jgi:hypothetical protein
MDGIAKRWMEGEATKEERITLTSSSCCMRTRSMRSCSSARCTFSKLIVRSKVR